MKYIVKNLEKVELASALSFNKQVFHRKLARQIKTSCNQQSDLFIACL